MMNGGSNPTTINYRSKSALHSSPHIHEILGQFKIFACAEAYLHKADSDFPYTNDRISHIL